MSNNGASSSSWNPSPWNFAGVASGVTGLGATGAAHQFHAAPSVYNPMGVVLNAHMSHALNQWEIENLKAWKTYTESGQRSNFDYGPQWEAANPTSANDPNGDKERNDRIARGHANFVRTHVTNKTYY